MLTTTTPVLSTRRAPSVELDIAEPRTREPPWIHTKTGRGPEETSAGVQTLRRRQSSAPLILPLVSTWAQRGPNFVASHSPSQLVAGRGGRHRHSPSGAAA